MSAPLVWGWSGAAVKTPEQLRAEREARAAQVAAAAAKRAARDAARLAAAEDKLRRAAERAAAAERKLEAAREAMRVPAAVILRRADGTELRRKVDAPVVARHGDGYAAAARPAPGWDVPATARPRGTMSRRGQGRHARARRYISGFERRVLG